MIIRPACSFLATALAHSEADEWRDQRVLPNHYYRVHRFHAEVKIPQIGHAFFLKMVADLQPSHKIMRFVTPKLISNTKINILAAH
jgi:hypothetical protein